jgi:hypothetical protein
MERAHLWQLLETAPNAMLVTGGQALRKFLIKTILIFSPQECVSKSLEQN